MGLILCYDTETTGLPLFKEPSNSPAQPHIVQFAALLIDEETREEVEIVNLIVKPDGWIIPDEVAAIHGITTERALAEGWPEELITLTYAGLASRASLRVAHNINFDQRIMRIALLRAGVSREEIEVREQLPKFCTMNASLQIVKAPPTEKMRAAGFTKPKPPRLSECIRHFFDEDLEGAHDAMNDVRACARVYFHLQSFLVAA